MWWVLLCTGKFRCPVGGLIHPERTTEMNIDELLTQARDDRGKSVTRRCVDLVKAHDENKRLGGTVDYTSILSAIVDSYGTTGVKYSLVKEVLHEIEKLNAAVKDLVDAKKITRGIGKRDFLLTTTKKLVDQPKEDQPQPDEPNADDDTGSDDGPPAGTLTKPKRPAGK